MASREPGELEDLLARGRCFQIKRTESLNQKY
jgi:hypothetical protein